MDQGYEGMHYFQYMRLNKETNVKSITENFEKIDDVVSSKLIEL